MIATGSATARRIGSPSGTGFRGGRYHHGREKTGAVAGFSGALESMIFIDLKRPS